MHTTTSTYHDISTTNEFESSQYLAWIVLVAISMFFFYEYMQMNLMNSLESHLRQEFQLTASQYTLPNFYNYANMIFLFPAGMLLDRFSAKKMVMIALVVCVCSTLLFSVSHQLALMKGCRFFVGIGASFCLLGCVRLASRWFPPKKMALATGIIVAIGMSGGAVAQTPFSYLIVHYGWRSAVQVIAIIGVVVFFIITTMVKDYPNSEKRHYEQGHDQLQKMGLLKSMLRAFKNPQNFICGFYTAMMNLPLSICGAAWGDSILMSRGFTELQGANITMMIFIGTLVGSPTIGWLSDKIERRRLPMFVGALLSLALIIYIIAAPSDLSYLSYLGLFFLLGFITSCQVISYPTIAESNPSFMTGTSMSIASFIILSFYPLSISGFGYALDKLWSGELLNGARTYSVTAYSHAMWLIPLGFAIALALLAFLRETHCEPIEEV